MKRKGKKKQRRWSALQLASDTVEGHDQTPIALVEWTAEGAKDDTDRELFERADGKQDLDESDHTRGRKMEGNGKEDDPHSVSSPLLHLFLL